MRNVDIGLIAGIVVAVIIVVLIIALVVMYNNLVQLRNRVDNAWAQIDVQLQRRLDLIPNLVETVKGYATHENSTLRQVTEARSAVAQAPTPEAKVAADSMLTGALKSLFAVAEAYPNLKANVNFQQLQSELSSTEDKISYMRQSYNDVVMMYNNALQTFPSVLIASLFHFEKRESFDANAAAAAAPVVSFGQGNGEGGPQVSASTAPMDVPGSPSITGAPSASGTSPASGSPSAMGNPGEKN